MDAFANITKEVLAGIRPSKEEEKEVFSRIKEFLAKVNKGLKDAEAVLGGSGAKGTWLSRAHDADVFVEFRYDKYKFKSDELSLILEKHLKKIFPKMEKLHGSRDYFQVKDNNFTFEIVPILKIKNADDAMNITDVSMLHSTWVRKKIKKDPKLADDIRLLKQFCKANKVYGAESYIKGLSGYICEILVINYKGFMPLIREAAKWKDKTIIDTEKYYKKKTDVLFNINKSKLEGPLVVVDPVQKTRNAAAALNVEMFSRFIGACQGFLKAKSKSFFETKEIGIEEIKNKAGKDILIIVESKAGEGKEDIVGCKLVKAFNFIAKELGKKDFDVKEQGWQWDKKEKAIFWFIVSGKKLSDFVIVQGPPIEMKDFAANFKKKYKETYAENGKNYAKVKREFTYPVKLVQMLLSDEYLKDKVEKARLIQ